MNLTVLSVAYPFAAVGPDAVGGAEQVVYQLDRALTSAGHRSLVLASAGSRVTGTLVPVPEPAPPFGPASIGLAEYRHRQAIRRALATWRIDLVHMHGIDFNHYLPPPGPPVLVTLHLPPSWYPQEIFQPTRPRTFLHCVSEAQRRTCPSGARLLPEIGNGVETGAFERRHAKRGFALAIGRICPEKGFHLALDAARSAGMPLLLCGKAFAYPGHLRFFRREIAPRLDRWRRFLGPVGFLRKRRLMAAARCLVVPSLAPETSSLVAMEALAAGTPVVAFPAGALTEIVEHGRTGFLVRDAAEMARAMEQADVINPDTCRASARARFSLDEMTSRYLELYRELASA